MIRPWLFPLGVACIYGLGFIFAPDGTQRAVDVCGSMFRQLIIPILLAVVMMVVFNRCLSPVVVTNFLGRNAGLKGILLSSVAGILSMGPIYAWYPLFKTLKDKGASVFHVANFIGCRSIKPVLLPVMVAYFGWRFASIFVLAGLVLALLVACIVTLACSWGANPEVDG